MGLKLSVWRRRASAILRGTRGLISRGWTKLTWPGRMAAAGWVLLLAGALVAVAAARLRPARLAGVVAAEAGFFVVLVAAMVAMAIGLWRAWRNRRPGLGRSVPWFMLFVAGCVVVTYFPVIAAALATSGGSGIRAIYNATGGGTGAFRDWWVFDTVFWCTPAIVAIAVIIPQLLHDKLPWRPEFVLPAWLAGFAAVATWLIVFLLYFNGLRPPGGAVGLAVGATFASALLAPFYRFLARSIWDRGALHVFDPRDWWSAWSKAYQEVRLAFPRPAVAAKSTQTPDPQVKFLKMLTGLDLTPSGNPHY